MGELTVYDRTAPAELLERSAGAEVLITNKTVITAEDMAALPALKYIGVLATGYNIVDIQAAKARGIIVTNIPAYSTASVALMKPTAILINTGRGPLVNEKDLADALNKGVIAAAGLDVLSSEPPQYTNPLLTAKNCFITPHIAWATKEARVRLMRIAVGNLKGFIKGEIVNNVAE